MQIARSNYEIWLIDWLDGNLSDSQVGLLQHFLEENPDLKEELNELTTFRLNPSGKSFALKDLLKKTPSDLSGLQFEFLCVAHLENDLSSVQETEMKESIEKDPEKRKSFELIQKMRLSPVKVSYKQKNRLIRRTVVQKVIRLSIIGLSAAAVTTLLIITDINTPRSLPVKAETTAQALKAENTILKPAVAKVQVGLITKRKIVPIIKQPNRLLAVSNQSRFVSKEPDTDSHAQSVSIPVPADTPQKSLKKITVSSGIVFKRENIHNTLIALNSTKVVPVYDDGRSKLSRFISKTFREKILKENTAKDSPLKAYEIAEAGVSGLNKLLGWEMALDKKNDENGELSSIYFSSKILKFNTPIKKTQPLQ